jgi:hypothetical protein
MYMALKEKKIHMLFEFLALTILIPFFIHLLIKYKFKYFDKYFLILIILTTLLVDGYLLFSWFRKEEKFKNQEKKKKLLEN